MCTRNSRNSCFTTEELRVFYLAYAYYILVFRYNMQYLCCIYYFLCTFMPMHPYLLLPLNQHFFLSKQVSVILYPLPKNLPILKQLF